MTRLHKDFTEPSGNTQSAVLVKKFLGLCQNLLQIHVHGEAVQTDKADYTKNACTQATPLSLHNIPASFTEQGKVQSSSQPLSAQLAGHERTRDEAARKAERVQQTLQQIKFSPTNQITLRRFVSILFMILVVVNRPRMGRISPVRHLEGQT